MSRRLPIIPTIIVALAVALMIGLGIWQLQRAKWKEGLLAQYAEAQKLPPIAWPTVAASTMTSCRCSDTPPATASRRYGHRAVGRREQGGRAGLSSRSSIARRARKGRG